LGTKHPKIQIPTIAVEQDGKQIHHLDQSVCVSYGRTPGGSD
jgi:hypothetical protein